MPTWEKGLLKLTSIASGPVATAPDARFPLVLAAKRTKRPDVLNKFRMYRGGWDITNKHYWAVSSSSPPLSCFNMVVLYYDILRAKMALTCDRDYTHQQT